MSGNAAEQVARTGRSTEHPHRRGPAPWAVVLVGLGALAVLAAFLPAGPSRWLPAMAGVAAVLAAAEGVLLQVRAGGLRGGVARDPLVLLLGGLCLTVASEVLRSSGSAAPGYSDAVALTAYPFFLAGLVRLTRTRLKEGALDTLLLAAIIPAVVLAFAWLPLADAIGRWSSHEVEKSWRTAAFLVVDVLAVTIIARLAVTFRGKPMAYQLLVGAAGCFLGAHVSRAVGEITRLVPAPLGSQTLLIVGFALFAAAALHPSLRRADARTRVVMLGRWHVSLLMLAVLVGPTYAVVRYSDRGSWVLVVAVVPAVVSLLVVGHLSRMISERQRLEFTASHDALTGLPNKMHFHERLALSLGRADDGVGVLFLDLDRFKDINDSYGHDAGDDLLCQVAQRLQDCVREGDLVARLAGDEFAVLLVDGTDDSRATAVSERMLARFTEPFRLGDHSVPVSPSIGVALFPQHGSDVEELIRNADSAMYAAKAAGRNTVTVYRPGMETQANQRLVVEESLRAAIEGRQLTLHYQPKLDARTGAIVGVEALVRWDHPVHGLIPPTAFIPAAEQSGLVAPLGTWVLTTACRQAEEWRRAGHRDLPVSVNLSARQFELQSVPLVVANALRASGLPAHLLELELTESIPMDRDGAVAAALQELDVMGVRCSIDDFGTGYSNIGYLHEFPISTVKLDRSFVRTVDGPGSDSPIVRGVIALAHSLGLRVVAEGVETRHQLGFLQKHGCDELQGFLFSPGVPAGAMSALLVAGIVRGTDPWQSLPWEAVSDEPEWDEKKLQEALWATRGQELLEEDEQDVRGTRVVVMSTASGFMVLPTLLGLGSAGGLPPQVQTRVTAAFEASGVVTASDAAPPAADPVLATETGRKHRDKHARPATTAGSTHRAGRPAGVDDSVEPVREPTRVAEPPAHPDAGTAPVEPADDTPLVDAGTTVVTPPVTPGNGKANGKAGGKAGERGCERHRRTANAGGAGNGNGNGNGVAKGHGVAKGNGNGKAAGNGGRRPPATAPATARPPDRLCLRQRQGHRHRYRQGQGQRQGQGDCSRGPG